MSEFAPVSGHQRLQLTLRPARSAVFVSQGDAWRIVARRLIEAFSRTWAGECHVAVPTNGTELDEVFWRLVRAHDPDFLGAYQRTLRHDQLADTSAFEGWLTHEAEMWHAEHPESSVNEAKSLLLQAFDFSQPIGPLFQPGPPLSQQLKQNTSSYGFGDHPVGHPFVADDSPPHPIVDMTDIAQPSVSFVNELDTAALPEDVQLMLLARTGALAPSHVQAIKTQGGKCSSEPVSPNQIGSALELYWRSEVRDAPPGPPRKWAASGFLTHAPLQLTRTGLSSMYRASSKYFAGRRRAYFVVGQTAADFWLAYGLDRLLQRGWWLPPSIIGDDDELKTTVTRSAARWIRELLADNYTDVLIVSTSKTAEELHDVRDRLLAQMLIAPESPASLSVATVAEVEFPVARRFLDAKRLVDVRHEPFDTGEMVGTLTLPVPSSVEGKDLDSIRWLVDVAVATYRLPARDALNSLVVPPGIDAELVRCGSDGITCQSHSLGFIAGGTPLELRLMRPRLRVPTGEQLFTALLNASDMSAQRSIAGIYTAALIDGLGGLDIAAATLSDPAKSAALHAYCSELASSLAPGDYIEGRRYLSLADIETASGLDEEQARRFCDQYVRAGFCSGAWRSGARIVVTPAGIA